MEDPRVLSVQSHVCHGYVGNRCVTFPLQLLGWEVDVVNSVQFSNHLGYPAYRGQRLGGDDLRQLAEGLALNGLMGSAEGGGYSHVLTGFIGSETFLEAVLDLLRTVQEATGARAMYVCDPVLGDDGRLYVPEALIHIYRDKVLPHAYMLTPNQFEAEMLLERRGEIRSLEDALSAVDALHALGPEVVVITTVDCCASEEEVAMLLSTRGQRAKWLLRLPRVAGHFVGTGDLTAAMLLAWSHRHPLELPLAMEKAGAVVQSVLRRTVDAARLPGRPSSVPPELKLVQSKLAIEEPQDVWRCRAVWAGDVSASIKGVIFEEGALVQEGAARPGVKQLLAGTSQAGLLGGGGAELHAALHSAGVPCSFAFHHCGRELCLEAWGVAAGDTLLVAHSEAALTAGSAAGCRTCLLLGGAADPAAAQADCAVSCLSYLLPRLLNRKE